MCLIDGVTFVVKGGESIVVSCEKNTANINCPPNTTVRVTHAMYGRTTADVQDCFFPVPTRPCVGDVTTDVQCICNDKNSCSVKASNSFSVGDPCRRKLKYLEVRYLCYESKHLICSCIITPRMTFYVIILSLSLIMYSKTYSFQLSH